MIFGVWKKISNTPATLLKKSYLRTKVSFLSGQHVTINVNVKNTVFLLVKNQILIDFYIQTDKKKTFKPGTSSLRKEKIYLKKKLYLIPKNNSSGVV